jgi:hypothetical protein
MHLKHVCNPQFPAEMQLEVMLFKIAACYPQKFNSFIFIMLIVIFKRLAVSSPNEVEFFILPAALSRTMALGLTQPLTEMGTRKARNLPGG